MESCDVKDLSRQFIDDKSYDVGNPRSDGMRKLAMKHPNARIRV